MKLLFDQNLSFRLTTILAASYPNSSHVRSEGLDRADDQTIWDFAKKNGFAIVSQDIDFYERVRLYGHPPKVIWLRCGNAPTDKIADLLKRHQREIDEFERDTVVGCIEIA